MITMSLFIPPIAGYKGYGLSMMVEVFCGILSGSMFGPHVRKWKETHKTADLVRNQSINYFAMLLPV